MLKIDFNRVPVIYNKIVGGLIFKRVKFKFVEIIYNQQAVEQ